MSGDQRPTTHRQGAEPMNKEKIIATTKKMHALQRELWSGKKMGECAFALALDGYETAILKAIGEYPESRRASGEPDERLQEPGACLAETPTPTTRRAPCLKSCPS